MKIIFIISALLIVSAFARQGFGPTDQEWGYVTIRENAQMFWWLHYTTANVSNITDRPLLLWLSGGPGSSSTGLGNFQEIGPLDVDLNVRNYSWDRHGHVLFVDNPVGSGWSYVETTEAFTTTNREIADDFLVFLKAFFEQHSVFRTVPLYIIGESYAGKMIPEIALVLYQAIQHGTIDCNFKGIGLGNGQLSLITINLNIAPYLLNLGVLDERGYDAVMNVARQAKQLYDSGELLQAYEISNQMQVTIFRHSYGIDPYSVLRRIAVNETSTTYGYTRQMDITPMIKIMAIMNNQVGPALNISRPWTWWNTTVGDYLAEDNLKPISGVLEELLNTTDLKIAVYNGQLDVVCNTPANVQTIDSLNWPLKQEWMNAARVGFATNGYFEGHVKRAGNLAFYWVDRAGHMVPADNPNGMEYVLRDLTNDFEV